MAYEHDPNTFTPALRQLMTELDFHDPSGQYLTLYHATNAIRLYFHLKTYGWEPVDCVKWEYTVVVSYPNRLHNDTFDVPYLSAVEDTKKGLRDKGYPVDYVLRQRRLKALLE